MRKRRISLILSSLATLLPIAAGLLLWNQLPDVIATHWNFHGQADGWSSKSFAVFFLPLLLLGVHWLCVFITARDPGNQEQNKKALSLVVWIVPLISNICCGMVYAIALGVPLSISTVMYLMVGILFLIIGNYLPKCRRNHTIGIRIPWTLADEDTWNATHRFGGRVWIAGSIGILLCAFLPEAIGLWVMFAALAVLVIVPMVYAYRYYHRHCKEN